jgi:hypothetical protein
MQDVSRLKRRTWQDGARFDVPQHGANPRDCKTSYPTPHHLLDPVRGEPAAYGLDRDPNEIELQRERQLKRKFLDSFALISATKKDGDTVSAASIEEGLPEGTVVRVASNHGVKNTTLRGLRDLVAILNGVASRGE